MLSKYYETWYIQQLIPDPEHVPPAGWPQRQILGDGKKIKGLFIPNQSSESLMAGALAVQTTGRFITDVDAPLLDPGIFSISLRNAKTGIFIRTTGEPLVAPERAKTQAKQYPVVVTDRAQSPS